MSNCEKCGQEVKPAAALRIRLRKVNDILWECGKTYYETLGDAHYAATASLSVNDFDTQPFIDCPFIDRREGYKFQSAPVGDGKYITATYYRRSTGRWELVAYVN